MGIHIGEKIRLRAKELRIGPTELARQISTSKQNVYGIYKRESIDTELLQKLSRALNQDFFYYYIDPKLSVAEEELPKYNARNKQKNEASADEAGKIRKELDDLSEKFEYLKRLYEFTVKELSELKTDSVAIKTNKKRR
jgi:transcriptional regulator with XRE-family HTH domain